VPNKPGYFERYYSEKHGEINEKRRKKYQNDSEYRDRVLKASRDYRERQRAEPRVRMPRFHKSMVGEIGGGGQIHLWSVGAFAAYLSRSVQSINHWEKTGILPKTPYRDVRGFRFYTPAMMNVVRDQVGTKRRLFPVDPQMYANIMAAWEAQGVPVDCEAQDPRKQMKKALAATTSKEEPEEGAVAAESEG
jgi:hypothetical protein